MTFEQYELKAQLTATYKDADYLPLGLAEETGELIQLFAESKRKGTKIDRKKLLSEMGDVLWVLSQIAREHGLQLEDAAYDNLVKLQQRSEKGAIHEKHNR